MNRFAKIACLAVILGLAAGVMLPTPASAQQVIYSYSSPPPVVSYYPPAPPPVVSYYPPPPPATVTYYPPPVQATVTYYPPPPTTVTYSYYPPPTTVYSAPTAVYASPAVVYAPTTVVTPGSVTTRTYLGLGVFRPFGVNRDVYVTPGRVTYYP